MVTVPTIEEEDAKRPGRERESLVGERTRIINRMKAALARLGIRGFKPELRNAPARLETLTTAENTALPPNTLAEIRRDMTRLAVLQDQIKGIEQARLEGLRQTPDQPAHAMVLLLARVIGVGSRAQICSFAKSCFAASEIGGPWPAMRDLPARPMRAARSVGKRGSPSPAIAEFAEG